MLQQKIKRAFNRAANSYDEHCHLQWHIGNELIDLLKTHAPKGRVVDLGCGTGLITEKLLTTFSFQESHAVDFAEILLQKANERLATHNVFVHCADFENLKPIENTFDLMFSNMALHWSQHLPATLSNLIQQHLNPQGLLAFSIPITGTLKELIPHFAVQSFFASQSIIDILHNNYCRLLTAIETPIILDFPNALSALRSLKKVGANATSMSLSLNAPSKSSIRNLSFSQLTYHIGYFIAQRGI